MEILEIGPKFFMSSGRGLEAVIYVLYEANKEFIASPWTSSFDECL